MADVNFMKLLDIYGPKEVENMKFQLQNQVDILVEKEKRFCARKKKPRIMNEDKRKEIQKLITTCHNAFQVEALRRIIFFYNIIPSFKEVEGYGNAIRENAMKGITTSTPFADA